jgi:hypothetical protein
MPEFFERVFALLAIITALCGFAALVWAAFTRAPDARVVRLRVGAIAVAVGGIFLMASGLITDVHVWRPAGGFMLVVLGTGLELRKVGVRR